MPALKAKSTPRPPRLVASKRRAAASKPIAAMNSVDSPFLRLAPELRNRIYELVLGGKTLHFNGHGKAVRICSHFNESASFRNYRANHMKCALGAKYCTSLLRVCRQISEEAALIPFTSNTFALHIGSNHLWSLIDVLLPAQRKAVKSLELRSDRPFKVDGTKVKQLTGLRDLKVKLFLVPSSLEENGGELEKLGNGRLKSVKVDFLPFFIENRPLADFAPWTAQMEQKLLNQKSYSERKKEAMLGPEKARASSQEARKARKAEQNREKDEAMKASATIRENRGLRALH